MNHEPTVGVPAIPTLVSLMKAFASWVPLVFVVPERPAGTDGDAVQSVSPPTALHNEP